MGGQAAAALYWTLKQFGKDGIRKILDHNLEMTDYLAEIITKGGHLRALFEHDLNTICIIPNGESDCFPESMNPLIEETCAELEKQHGIYISTTTLPIADKDGARHRRDVFRVVPTHPHTDKNDIEYIAESLIETWKSKLNRS